ncbi:cyclic nucleotide-binding domain-containing protein [Rubinisphaera margarita]|uniref:cyclic nucleotide-binding domain-containing protein n=1 Tax=Rubinisphaera margarita TaxID=2909586 RepID=UPI001EE89A6B|nr:cyclic nucleotide-binding domain-containing protein [Rubinisphaera margarita]MCG6156146.1 cyclic nucleotide-binding domain-containing protein [Rubinisphaera margarita]
MSTTTATIEDLEFDSTPLMRGLNEAQVEEVFNRMEHLCYESDALILTQGEANPGIWLLSAGCAEVVRDGIGGQPERVLAVLGPGSVFGEMSFFRKTPHTANVRSVRQSTVHKLSWSALEDLRQDAGDIALVLLTNIVTVAAERLHLMDNWVCRLLESNEVPSSSGGGDARFEEWHEFRAKLYREWDF